jgi:endonuclease-3
MPPKAIRPGPTPKPAKKPRGGAVASKARIEEIFRRFQAANPEPKGELEYVNPYTLLVAVVLSAQATDAGVNKATRGLFKAADTPAKMLALGAVLDQRPGKQRIVMAPEPLLD